MIRHLDSWLEEWLEHLEEREIATKNGAEKNSCFPQFRRFNN